MDVQQREFDLCFSHIHYVIIQLDLECNRATEEYIDYILFECNRHGSENLYCLEYVFVAT